MGISLLTTALARADVLPPAGDCENKSEGVACKDSDGKAGACATIAYTRMFFSPVPGAAPQSREAHYFGCKAGATPTKTIFSCSVSDLSAHSDDAFAFLFVALAAGLTLRSLSRKRRAVIA